MLRCTSMSFHVPAAASRVHGTHLERGNVLLRFGHFSAKEEMKQINRSFGFQGNFLASSKQRDVSNTSYLIMEYDTDMLYCCRLSRSCISARWPEYRARFSGRDGFLECMKLQNPPRLHSSLSNCRQHASRKSVTGDNSA